jgi:MFS family permease
LPVVILLWLLLFFGGTLTPTLTGLMISSAAEDERTQAGSLFNLIVNTLGFLPSPTIYGVVQQLTGGETSRWGLIFIMSMSLVSLCFLLTFRAIRLREMREEGKQDT